MAHEKSNQMANKLKVLQILVNYLTKTKPVLLFVHLLWIMMVCGFLSVTYVISFHFTSLLSVYQDAHNIRNFSTNLIINTRNDTEINRILTDILETTKASRAYIFRYHNGLAAVNGVPFFFQTNTHEVISPGTSRVIQFEQHIPASINIAVNNQFMANRCSMIAKTDEDRDSQHYWFFQARAAKSLIRCPIFMQNGDLFGFVGVDFPDRTEQSRLESLATQVRATASRLTSVFANLR
jgi:hypothetical protein